MTKENTWIIGPIGAFLVVTLNSQVIHRLSSVLKHEYRETLSKIEHIEVPLQVLKVGYTYVWFDLWFIDGSMLRYNQTE